jgi:8-oxo-dGTP pyrophosphatase MutT (NUDIX family)
MYKVFFNDRTIYLVDEMPDFKGDEDAFICTFLQKDDLGPQLNNYLRQDMKADLYVYSPVAKDAFGVFRSCFRNIPAAGGLVKNRRNEYLIIFRRGKWDLPKGKAEKKETSEETALREVQEECNLDGITLESYLTTTYHIYHLDEQAVLKQTDWYMMGYSGTKEPVPAKSEDIERTVWMTPSQVTGITGNIFPSIIEVLRTAPGIKYPPLPS